MYIKYLHEDAPWLTEEEVFERLKNDIARGRFVEATEEEMAKVDAGDWKRVGTWTICKKCNKPYVDHPVLDYMPWLHRLCDGLLGKT